MNKSKTYYIVWNPDKSEGFVTDDMDDAEFARAGFQAGASVSTTAMSFREAYTEIADDDDVELPMDEMELPA